MPSSRTTPAAFLSVRLPPALRDRLKVAAATRGVTVQSLVGGLVEGFLVTQAPPAPDLAELLGRLRAHQAALKARGLSGLWLFGSVARGEARPDSDIDLMAEFADDAPVSLVTMASLRAELSELLGAPADLVERSALRPDVRAAAEREAVRIL